MPVNVLNLPGLRVLDFKEADTNYHVKTGIRIFRWTDGVNGLKLL